MSSVVPVFLSVSEAAEAFGRDRRTIARRIRQLGIRPTGERRGHPLYRLRDLMRIERQDAEGLIDPDKLSPFERQAHFKAESERLRVDAQRSRLVRAEDAAAEFDRIRKIISEGLDALATETRTMDLPPACVEAIARKVAFVQRLVIDGGSDANQ